MMISGIAGRSAVRHQAFQTGLTIRGCLRPLTTATFVRPSHTTAKRPSSSEGLRHDFHPRTAISLPSTYGLRVSTSSKNNTPAVLAPEVEADAEAGPSVYSPPTTGIISRLPTSWVPYAELIRIDKPTGTYYLFWPCLFSTLLAAPMATPVASPTSVLGTSLLFLTGAFIMRGAGCTVNDLLDRKFDKHVTRTKFRPIARGSISPKNAILFTGAQGLAGLAVLLQFPPSCFFYAVPSLALVTLYPLAKRYTNYPQVVFGLSFAWGSILGFPALGIDLLSNSAALTSAACLYASTLTWGVLYDMIYAHQDIKDDLKAGIKSMALKHDAETKQVLAGLAVVQVGLLAAAGVAAGAGPAFFVGSCGGALVTLGIMIRRVNLKSVKDCWWWFVNGCWITGGIVSLGLGADYLVQYRQRGGEKESKSIE
jgi:4-hydroxybenzoate polyprenyltransferase